MRIDLTTLEKECVFYRFGHYGLRYEATSRGEKQLQKDVQSNQRPTKRANEMSDKEQQQISLIATNVAGQTIAMASTLPALLRAVVRHYGDHEAITIHDDGERVTWSFRGKTQPHQWPSRQKHPDGVSLELATETALRLVVRHYQQQGLCYVYQVKELSL